MSTSSFPLDQLGLTPHQLAACNRAGFVNAADVLLPSIADLNRKLKFSRLEGVTDLVKAVSRAIIPSPLDLKFGNTNPAHGDGRDAEGNGDEVVSGGGGDVERTQARQGDWVGTGDVGLDGILGGGLRVGTITEITGESAAGKSHWCLSLALAAQIPTLATNPGAAMILTSEREIATDRMIELAHHLLESHDPQGEIGTRPKDMLDNVLSNIVQDITMLEHTLTYKVPFILRSRLKDSAIDNGNPLLGGRSFAPPQKETIDPPGGHQEEDEARQGVHEEPVVTKKRPDSGILPVRLLIVDSITALIRGADSSYAKSSSIGLTERSRHLCAVADKLKALAVEFTLAIVVINQVSDVFTRTPTYGSSQPSSSLPLSQFYTEGPEPPMLYATQSRHFSGQSETLKKEASLGIVWANAVNTRIMLSRTGRRKMIDPKDLSKRLKRRKPQEEEDPLPQRGVLGGPGPVVDDSKPTLIRRAHVVFSGFAPPATIDYVITTSGIHSIPDSHRLVDIAETLKRKERLARAILYGQDEDEREENSTSSRIIRVPPGQATTRDDAQIGAEGSGAEGRDSPDWDDEFGEEVFDDLGELPIEFWEGRMEDVVTEPLALGAGI